MSEERFDRIEQALGRIEAGQQDLRQAVGGLDGRLTGVEGHLTGLDGRLTGVEGRLAAVEGHLRNLDARVTDVNQHMRILHENAIHQIQAVAEDVTALDAKIDRRADEVMEALGQRIDPLAAAVRHHGIEIARLKKRRG